ncbi:lactate/malate family dehydrogenase [Rhodococcus opacus]
MSSAVTPFDTTQRPRVTVLGAGNVGTAITQRLFDSNQIGELILYSSVPDLAAAKALDITHSAERTGSPATVVGTSRVEETAESDMVVVASSVPYRPGSTRSDQAHANRAMIGELTQRAASVSPSAVVVVVTNPVEQMCHIVYESTGFAASRVLGSAGLLDSNRLATVLAREMGTARCNVSAMVLGEHGSRMFCASKETIVDGTPIASLLTGAEIRSMVEIARQEANQIVQGLRTATPSLAPAACTARMIAELFNPTGQLMPCTVHLDGQYGVRGVFIGAPVRLGNRGVETIAEVPLTPAEHEAMLCGAQQIRATARRVQQPGVRAATTAGAAHTSRP